MALTKNQIVTAQTITGGAIASQLGVRAIATTCTAYRLYGQLDTTTATNRSLVTNHQSRVVLKYFPFHEDVTAAAAYAAGKNLAKTLEIPWPISGGLGITYFQTPPISACIGRVFYWFETPGTSADTIGVLDAWELETTLSCTSVPV